MAFNPGVSITGAAISGLTSPTYTLTQDSNPAANAKQFAVTALGGTQTGVDANTVSKPFLITAVKPVQLKTAGAPNPTTGVLKNVPNNSYKIVTKKGALPAANQVPYVARVTTIIDVPAGTDTYEPEELKAMLSAHFGALWANAQGISDTVITGIL